MKVSMATQEVTDEARMAIRGDGEVMKRPQIAAHLNLWVEEYLASRHSEGVTMLEQIAAEKADVAKENAVAKIKEKEEELAGLRAKLGVSTEDSGFD